MIGYCRVSSDGQAATGYGLEDQRQAIASAAEQRNWDLVRTVEDPGLSGGSIAKRPELLAALRSLTAGEADGLVVSKLDRLSRSVLDFATLLEQSRREGWTLVALDLGLDTSSPQGELMAVVLASFAQFERKLGGQRTAAALRVLKDQGVKLGRPRSISDELFHRMTEMRAQVPQMSYRAIADVFNTEAIPTGQGGRWYPATIQQAIKSRSNNQGE